MGKGIFPPCFLWVYNTLLLSISVHGLCFGSFRSQKLKITWLCTGRTNMVCSSGQTIIWLVVLIIFFLEAVLKTSSCGLSTYVPANRSIISCGVSHRLGIDRHGFTHGWDCESTAWFSTDVLSFRGMVPILGCEYSYLDDDTN